VAPRSAEAKRKVLHIAVGGFALLAPRLMAACIVLASVCGVVESLPWSLDDNLTVPVAGGLVMAALDQV